MLRPADRELVEGNTPTFDFFRPLFCISDLMLSYLVIFLTGCVGPPADAALHGTSLASLSLISMSIVVCRFYFLL